MRIIITLHLNKFLCFVEVFAKFVGANVSPGFLSFSAKFLIEFAHCVQFRNKPLEIFYEYRNMNLIEKRNFSFYILTYCPLVSAVMIYKHSICFFRLVFDSMCFCFKFTLTRTPPRSFFSVLPLPMIRKNGFLSSRKKYLKDHHNLLPLATHSVAGESAMSLSKVFTSAF